MHDSPTSINKVWSLIVLTVHSKNEQETSAHTNSEVLLTDCNKWSCWLANWYFLVFVLLCERVINHALWIINLSWQEKVSIGMEILPHEFQGLNEIKLHSQATRKCQPLKQIMKNRAFSSSYCVKTADSWSMACNVKCQSVCVLIIHDTRGYSLIKNTPHSIVKKIIV